MLGILLSGVYVHYVYPAIIVCAWDLDSIFSEYLLLKNSTHIPGHNPMFYVTANRSDVSRTTLASKF